ncbi:LysE family translocator [Glaciimonas sp. GS1]|uniref:LysE family translocator n=2 Tax=Glaciimonas soli TaxID=2590999 RepID=A0A843YQ65_9BURK|nr:LysE family translocator [Glaciimonas soli]
MMESLFPLALFAFVATITPGPNNIMLTSSGIMFGFTRTIPHIFGITVGFAALALLCALGVGSLLLAVPSMHLLLKTISSAYLLYLAWKLRNMSFNPADGQNAKPMSFIGAAAFQFANPKAWVMCITSASAFLPAIQPLWQALAVYCLTFAVVGLPCIALWAGTGSVLRRYLAQAGWRRLFCVVMVLLTIYTAVSVWL